MYGDRRDAVQVRLKAHQEATDTPTFGFVLLGTILLVGALLFLPAAVLGPVAEHLGPIPFGG